MADDSGAVAYEEHQLEALEASPDNPQSRIDGEPNSKRSRKAVKVLMNQVALEGGWSKTKHVVDTMTVSHEDGSKEQFARVSSSCQWLRCIVTDNNERGRMRFSKVLRMCREMLDAPEAEAAVAASTAPELNDEYDPMDAFAEMEEPQPKPKKDPKKKKSSRAIGAVRTIQMPQSPGSEDVVDVRFYMQSSKTKPALWIAVDHLAWVVEYAIAETDTLGVEDCDPVRGPNAADSAVAESRIIWDFETHAYNAAILKGDHAGKTRSMAPGELGSTRLAIARRTFGPSLTMKEATRNFLAKWCDAVTRNEMAEFEQTWSASCTAQSCTTTETETTDSCPTEAEATPA